MDPQVKIVNNELVCVKYNHNEHILLIIMDDQVPFKERLLCQKCLHDHQSVLNKTIPINSAIAAIKERIIQKNKKQEDLREASIRIIKQFCSKMNELQTKYIYYIQEILFVGSKWIQNLENLKQKDFDLINIIQELETYSSLKQFQENFEIQKTNNSLFKKMSEKYKSLQEFQGFQDCYNNFIKSLMEDKLYDEINQKEIKVSRCQLVRNVNQKEQSHAIAFNYSGTIMVAACNQHIKVWQFEKQNLCELCKLSGHTDYVYCIVFSKKLNWFASGSRDQTIRGWKMNEQVWKSSKPMKQHSNYVMCLIMNNDETQLISCSSDKTIVVWKVNCLSNQIEYDYPLENKHIQDIFSISLNEAETALVSCSLDYSIILWMKNINNKWSYQHQIIIDYYGYRISFIDSNLIAWQQLYQGIIHFYSIENNKLIRISQQNIQLNNETYDDWLFPIIVNKQKQIIIQKHNKFIYIFQRKQDGKLYQSCQPLEQCNEYNYGALTHDGEYLVIWTNQANQFRIYNIKYK